MPRKRKADASLEEEAVPLKKAATGNKQKKIDVGTKKTKRKLASKSTRKVKQAVKATKEEEDKEKNLQQDKTVEKNETKGIKKITENKKASGKPKAVQEKSDVCSNKKLKLKDLLKDSKWKEVLAHEFEQPYFIKLEETLQAEYAQGKEIFPPKDLIFNALHLTPIHKVKVVILSQDPYHDNGQAMGLSFSVPKGIDVPPSLRNIFKELERDPKIEGFKIPNHGCLEDWAKEGVLMINATLTVEAHKANSHAKFGWQTFTDSIIKAVSDHCDHVVFILWGGFAHKKEKIIDTKKHAAIRTAHPSPLSLNKFKNCNCFSDCDDALVKFGLKRVNWSLA